MVYHLLLQVFYASTKDSDSVHTFWVVDNEINLSRLRFQLPPCGDYKVTDAALCKSMVKMIASTQKGRLIVFHAVVVDEINDVGGNLADEQIEEKHITKVAHEVCTTPAIHLFVSLTKDFFESSGMNATFQEMNIIFREW